MTRILKDLMGLDTFCSWNGQQINFAKPDILFSKRISGNVKRDEKIEQRIEIAKLQPPII